MHGILLQTKDCCVHVCVCLCSACFLSMMSWWYMSHVSPTTMLLVDQQCELPRRWRAISQALVISQSLCAYRRIMMTEEVKYCFMVCKDEWHAWWWGMSADCFKFQVSTGENPWICYDSWGSSSTSSYAITGQEMHKYWSYLLQTAIETLPTAIQHMDT